MLKRNQMSIQPETHKNGLIKNALREKKLFYKYLNSYRKVKNDYYRIQMGNARSEYKETIRQCKLNHDKNALASY